MLEKREKCLKIADQYLAGGKSVAVGARPTRPVQIVHILICPLDNTNADIEVRKKWIELAAKRSVPIRCVHFTAAADLCEHNDAVRALNRSVCDPDETFLHAWPGPLRNVDL
jgi:bifunctional polynucleotide phosphatase/kinase